MSFRSLCRSLRQLLGTNSTIHRQAARRLRLAAEELERREVPAMLALPATLDFGTAASPVAAGTIGVPVVAFSTSRGYGWESTTGIGAVTRGTADAFTTDFHQGNRGTFLVSLADGTYDVTLTLGDATGAHDQVALYLEGQLRASGLTSAAGQFLTRTFTTQVTDGRLNLRIVDQGGSDPNFALAGIAIRSSGVVPVASAGPDRTVNEGSAVTFAATLQGGTGPLRYDWTFGDGTTSTGSLTPTHMYVDNGTYTATLTVTDALGFVSKDSAVIKVVNVAPTVTVGPFAGTVAVPLSFSAGLTDPSAADTAAGFTYLWKFGDGTTSTAAAPTHTYAAVGTFAVSLTVTDKNGGKTVVTTSATITPSAVTALYVSTTGSDANSGDSAFSPLRSIATALGRLGAGMTLYLEGGVYYEQLVTRVSGTADQPITITSYNGTAILDGSTQSWTVGASQNQGMVELRNPYNILRNVEVRNSKNTGIVLGADNLTVAGCSVHDTQRHAISTDGKFQTVRNLGYMLRNLVVENCDVYRAVLKGMGYGQAISMIADGFSIRNNAVHHNVTEGIDIWLGATHGEVVGNDVYANQRVGIFIDGASYIHIRDNRVHDGLLQGIGISSENVLYRTHDIWVYNNLVYNNKTSGIFIWDSTTTPGYRGSQSVVLAHNTLVGNKTSFDFSGDGNSATVVNNLGYSTGSSVWNTSTNSSYDIRNNVWLSGAVGFVDAGAGDFHLTGSSSAIDKGIVLPPLVDDLGNSWTIGTDFGGQSRVRGSAPDAGAFEY